MGNFDWKWIEWDRGREGDTDTAEMEEGDGQRRDDGGKKRGRTRVPRSESCHSCFLP